MKEKLAVKATIADLRPTAAGTRIGIVVSLEREFDAPTLSSRVRSAVESRFHGTKAKGTEAAILEIDEPWLIKIDVVGSPLFHLSDPPSPEKWGLWFRCHI